MTDNKRRLISVLIHSSIFFLVCLFYSSGTIPLTIGLSTPFTVLPFLVAYSIFATSNKSCLAGLFTGIFLDSTAGNTYCFNAIVLMIISLLVCLMSNNLFNKNLKATFVISLLSAVAYFVLYWAFFFIIGYDINESLSYLFKIGFPSAVYTSFFIFPFYFLFKFLEKIK